ncbi:hypothetical protein FIBSPDRAFT_1038036 [Athelia psychrophila]|uniref:NB-ARC domain-containing protein n=1 Tax=Athelia psychrophila TaxID=1759441 RepID=A0A166TMJ5_9AGAM|nr:hypothetical protein FIBSPDRAFT_1038036 [Fibularhizoctonia sp. CBS 109695]
MYTRSTTTCVATARRARRATAKPSAPPQIRPQIPFHTPPTTSPVSASSTGPTFHTEHSSGSSTVFNIAGNCTNGKDRTSTTDYVRVNNAPIGIITRHFSGRNNELEGIRCTLHASDGNAVLTPHVVYGDAGIGKTQLALQFAKVEYANDTYSHIFYIPGTDARQGLENVLDIIHPSDIAHTIHNQGGLDQVQRWLAEPPPGVSWLLIVDHVTQASVNFLKANLPSKGGKILITTQSQEVAEAFGGTRVGLGPLVVDDAVDLLLSTAGVRSNLSSRVRAEPIVRYLNCLPVPIHQAGAYAQEAGGDLDLLLRTSPYSLAHFETSLDGYEHRSFAGMIESQFEHLRQDHPHAADLLKVLSHFDPTGIPVSMLVAGAESARMKLEGGRLAFTAAMRRDSTSEGLHTSHTFLDAIRLEDNLLNLLGQLRHLSLIHVDLLHTPSHSGTQAGVRPKESPKRTHVRMIRLNPFVRDVIREYSSQTASDGVWFSLAVDIIISAYSQSHHRCCQWCPYAPHIRSLLKWASVQHVHHAHRRLGLRYALHRLEKWNSHSFGQSTRESCEEFGSQMAFGGLTMVLCFAPVVAIYHI